MGTHWYVVDEGEKQVLEVGKFYALAKAAGMGSHDNEVPLTLECVEASKAGWFFDLGRPPRWKDAEWSACIAVIVQQWIAEVAPDRTLKICREGDWPWNDENFGADPASGWTFLTLYTHPLFDGPAPPWQIFPREP